MIYLVAAGVVALVMIALEVYGIRNHVRRMEKTLEVINDSVWRKEREE